MVPHLTPSCGGGTSSYLYKVGGKDRLGVLSPQYYVPCGAVKALSKEQIMVSGWRTNTFFYSREDMKIMKGLASSGSRKLEEVKRNSNCVSYEKFFSCHFQESSKTGTAYPLWEATASGMRNWWSGACPRSFKKFVAKLRIEAKSRTPRLRVYHEGRGQELTRGGHNHRKGRKLDCQQKYGERRTKKREEEDGGREEERREARDSGCLRVCASAAVHSCQAWLQNHQLSVYPWKITARPNSSLYLRRAFWIKGIWG